MQKISRIQTLMQIAESQIGQAAGMTQPKPAQTLIMDALDILEIDRPERFIADVPPNPVQIQMAEAKAAEMAAETQLKVSQATKTNAEATLAHSKTLREVGLSAMNSAQLQQHAREIEAGANIHHVPKPNPEVSAENDMNDASEVRYSSPNLGTGIILG